MPLLRAGGIGGAKHRAGARLRKTRAVEAVMLALAEQVDCAGGDTIGAADAPPEVAELFEADLAWLDEAVRGSCACSTVAGR